MADGQSRCQHGEPDGARLGEGTFHFGRYIATRGAQLQVGILPAESPGPHETNE